MNIIKSKIFKTVLCTIAISATGITAFKAYKAGNLTLPYNDSIIMENIEALSNTEGGVDLTVYNINSKEGWDKTEVRGRIGGDSFIVINGMRVKIGANVSVGTIIFYSICEESHGNYCKKSWAKELKIKYV